MGMKVNRDGRRGKGPKTLLLVPSFFPLILWYLVNKHSVFPKSENTIIFDSPEVILGRVIPNSSRGIEYYSPSVVTTTIHFRTRKPLNSKEHGNRNRFDLTKIALKYSEPNWGNKSKLLMAQDMWIYSSSLGHNIKGFRYHIGNHIKNIPIQKYCSLNGDLYDAKHTPGFVSRIISKTSVTINRKTVSTSYGGDSRNFKNTKQTHIYEKVTTPIISRKILRISFQRQKKILIFKRKTKNPFLVKNNSTSNLNCPSRADGTSPKTYEGPSFIFKFPYRFRKTESFITLSLGGRAGQIQIERSSRLESTHTHTESLEVKISSVFNIRKSKRYIITQNIMGILHKFLSHIQFLKLMLARLKLEFCKHKLVLLVCVPKTRISECAYEKKHGKLEICPYKTAELGCVDKTRISSCTHESKHTVKLEICQCKLATTLIRILKTKISLLKTNFYKITSNINIARGSRVCIYLFSLVHITHKYNE